MNDDASLVARLARLDTSVMSDVLDEAGLASQTLSSVLRPLELRSRLAGVALCASGRARIHAVRKDASNPISVYELERRVGPATVLVIDAGAENVGAVVGGFMAATFKAKGCRGLLVNGAVRDALELLELGLPTFSRFLSPANAARRWELASVEAPIAMPGMNGAAVLVSPGDFILGDADGVVVIPRGHAQMLIEDAETLQRIEEAIRAQIAGGATREEAFAEHPRFAHVRAIRV